MQRRASPLSIACCFVGAVSQLGLAACGVPELDARLPPTDTSTVDAGHDAADDAGDDTHVDDAGIGEGEGAPPDAGDVDAGDVDAGDVDAGDVDAGDVDPGDVDAGAAGSVVTPFLPGLLAGARPDRTTLLPLPGGGAGGPVLVSNNPEVVAGAGNLYNNARALQTRGGTPTTLRGDFGVYLHHLVDTGTAGAGGGAPLYISLLLSNPNATDVTVTVRGTGLTQTETGGLGLGTSPDYLVSADALLDTPREVHTDVVIGPARAFVAWQRQVNDRAEVDGRFFLHTSAPVFVYVVATNTSSLNEAVTITSGTPAQRVDAPGDYRISGNPPPPFGREAGVYAHDTWRGTIALDVPAGPGHVGYVVNTATGAGFAQVQAFPALAHLDGSAQEAVGMYGNFYDLQVQLHHDGSTSTRRRVRVWFTSLVTASISRYWDGRGLVDGVPIDVRHVPATPSTLLGERTIDVGGTTSLQFRAMVPGLASIPQALVVETLDP